MPLWRGWYYATEVGPPILRSPDLDSTSNSNHALSKNYSKKIFQKFQSFLSRTFYKKFIHKADSPYLAHNWCSQKSLKTYFGEFPGIPNPLKSTCYTYKIIHVIGSIHPKYDFHNTFSFLLENQKWKKFGIQPWYAKTQMRTFNQLFSKGQLMSS